MLRCAACGRRLIGDTGRYRHTEPCRPFVEAWSRPLTGGRPRRPIPGQHRQPPGHSYAAAEYEHLVREILGDVALGADTIEEVLRPQDSPAIDRLALARVERERSDVLARYRRDRDSARLEAEMARLDAAEQGARSSRAESALDRAESIAYLRNLPKLWDEAPRSQRAIAESLFDRLEVLGLATMHIEPTPAAIARGLADALLSVGGGYGRGERIEGLTFDLLVPLLHGGYCSVTIGGTTTPPRAVRSA
jgi:hypothetical protein